MDAEIKKRIAAGKGTAIMRCHWPKSDLSIAYHDHEWGVPLHDDRKFFEYLILDGAQAGLSWETILRKREAYRRAFAQFSPISVARFNANDRQRLLSDAGIVRNRLKIDSAIRNADAFLKVQKEFGSFDAYVWRFVNGMPIVNHRRKSSDIPARSKESDVLSKDLKSRGFNFVGTTICYAFMQAAGLVNDHLVSCFCHPDMKHETSLR
jgi:DNA-3-methyladenine glycosylase I